MHTSAPQSSSLRTDDRGVSEVVGQILMFGILSMVLILSLLSFNIAKEGAEERVVLATSESLALRVASLVIDTALLAEEFVDQDIALQSNLALPQTIEGRSYTISLAADTLTVSVPREGFASTAPLFSADSGATVHICDLAEQDGGSLSVFILSSANVGTRCEAGAQPAAQFYVLIEPFQE